LGGGVGVIVDRGTVVLVELDQGLELFLGLASAP
jgi:hypothetical protein